MRKPATVGGSSAVRKSTAILGGVWIATFIVYLFVKPAVPDHTGFPIANTFQKSAVTSTPAR